MTKMSKMKHNKVMANYKYWERFIKRWSCGGKAINGWTDPDLIPLYGNRKTLSSTYIPEPWWGNDGSSPLHSVVINLNPGRGYQLLMKSNVPYVKSYSKDIVKSGKLPVNDKWQMRYRAKPILDALLSLGVYSGNPSLSEHLSVELLPWHTPNVGSSYDNYLKANIKSVFFNTICFAADQSRKIANKKLNSVVILRMSGNRTNRLLALLNKIGITSSIKRNGMTPTGKGRFIEFEFQRIEGVRFVSIWGPRSRNNFPPQADLIHIVNLI